jgi:hypothetical protein
MPHFDSDFFDTAQDGTNRSVARADVAELSAAITPAVQKEADHHLVVVSTKKVLSSTQFKQMFYSRGDDYFQIANVYECPDSGQSVLDSVWGIATDHVDYNIAGDDDGNHPPADKDGGSSTGDEADFIANPKEQEDYLKSWQAASTMTTQERVYNFNKLGGRTNDPKGTQWAYSYVHDNSRNMYAQFEVMGNLEKDTCVKRDQWTTCSRMSIEDQLYGLAFASETDQDVCMKVDCARRWSEVEDALAESCLAAGHKIKGFTHYWDVVVAGWRTTEGVGFCYYDWEETETGSGVYPDRPDWMEEGDSEAGTGDYEIVTDGGEHDGKHKVYKHHNDHVDLYINVRVTNANPAALDTIFRIRFTIRMGPHYPSMRAQWNTSATKAASGVIQSGVVLDAPEGGKKQTEDSTVLN